MTLNGMKDIVNKPVHLFFQTGYLTIKGYDNEYNEYRLGFPNDEVKNGFLNFIYSYYVPVNPADDSTTTSTPGFIAKFVQFNTTKMGKM